MNERDVERQERWLADQLDDEERAQLESEALEDPRRAEALYAASALQASLHDAAHAKTSGTRPRAVRGRPRRRWLVGAGMLAAGLALVTLRPVLFPPESQRPTTWRSGEEASLELIAPLGPQERFPRSFSWHAGEDAALYRWELYDEEARLRSTEVLADTLLVRPAAETPADSLGLWRWLVVPITSDGSEGATSESLRFSVGTED